MSGRLVSEAVWGVSFFVVLLVLWPNVVHEPLHVAGLFLQGSSGVVHFGIHPSTARTAPVVGGVWGGLFWLLLPLSFQLWLLFLCVVYRRTPLLWKSVLAVYLGFDAVVNVLKYGLVFSDVHFLVAVPFGGVFACGVALLVSCGVLWVLWWQVRSWRVDDEVHRKIKVHHSLVFRDGSEDE